QEGYYSGFLEDARPGDLYRYRLNEEGLYPDPVSRFQPQGVHGPSRVVDPTAFSWTDHSWEGRRLEDLILYELHVGAFSPEGTFEGVIRRLPLLADLGVTAIELMPLNAFPGTRNWGYDGASLFAPAQPYGTPEELRRLVNEAHGCGLAVFVDAVYN